MKLSRSLSLFIDLLLSGLIDTCPAPEQRCCPSSLSPFLSLSLPSFLHGRSVWAPCLGARVSLLGEDLRSAAWAEDAGLKRGWRRRCLVVIDIQMLILLLPSLLSLRSVYPGRVRSSHVSFLAFQDDTSEETISSSTDVSSSDEGDEDELEILSDASEDGTSGTSRSKTKKKLTTAKKQEEEEEEDKTEGSRGQHCLSLYSQHHKTNQTSGTSDKLASHSRRGDDEPASCVNTPVSSKKRGQSSTSSLLTVGGLGAGLKKTTTKKSFGEESEGKLKEPPAGGAKFQASLLSGRKDGDERTPTSFSSSAGEGEGEQRGNHLGRQMSKTSSSSVDVGDESRSDHTHAHSTGRGREVLSLLTELRV